MYRFEIYLGSTLIGWSDLESGDPPMGVAEGRFIPAPTYSNEMIATEASQQPLNLRVRGGEPIQSVGGVCILDHSAELGPEAMEVSILGIATPLYESLFPEHVASYERQFPRGA